MKQHTEQTETASSTARRLGRLVVGAVAVTAMLFAGAGIATAQIGQEVAIQQHLPNGLEFQVNQRNLLRHGQNLFEAVWTVQEGGGRPLTKGVGAPLSDLSSPLDFPRNFNRVSAPDANSCFGCHNLPRSGGGGDIVANVFVLGQRFDFATFDMMDTTPTRGAVDENGDPVLLQTIANERNTLGMFGAGYIELLSVEITEDLQAIRDSIAPGAGARLESKGIDYGILGRNADGTYDVSQVEGLPFPSLDGDVPSLVIRPFHQASAVVSLREFSNNAFNHHHGIQAEERFGAGVDADGDTFVNEMTRADITAASLWQAQLAAPGRVIPNDPEIEQAVLVGERAMRDVGCLNCHISQLPLNGEADFVEPNPFNPPGNLQTGDAPDFVLDLSDDSLDKPRIPKDGNGVIWVQAFTDFKLHDITDGPNDPNCETLNMHHAGGSPDFLAGNCRFLTKKLWGAANEPPYFHHGKYTTMREAIEAHRGEAMGAFNAWSALSAFEQDSIIEALKTLQVLPRGTEDLVVDENFEPKVWPPANARELLAAR